MVVSRRPRYGATNHMRTEPRHGRRPQTYQHIIRGRVLRERLIVYRYLASHIAHFFVFSTSRSNSGCGSGEHKDGRRWRSRPMANRFDTHTSWLDGWAVWNRRWELSRRPQTQGIGNEILRIKIKKSTTCDQIPHDISSARTRPSNPTHEHAPHILRSRCWALVGRWSACGWSKTSVNLSCINSRTL